MMQIVYRLNGQVINIGPWDFKIEPVMGDDKERPILDPDTQEFVGYEQVKIGEIIGNPIPDGAVESKEEVMQRADGGFAAATDYAAMRRAEYPSLADQLDSIWKGGAELEDMRQRVLAIKTKYPKIA